jgi:hypothetical protein
MTRTVRLAVAVCALAVLSPLVASAAAQNGSEHKVLVATTGNSSELRSAVPISKTSGKKPRVVMSLGPDGLPNLGSNDGLKATAEVEVTTDCVEQGVRCVGKPYNYNPMVRASLVLAPGANVARSVNGIELGAQQRRCRQKAPDRQHHCVFVFTDGALDIASQGQLPCGPATCHLNLVVEASSPRAKKRQKLLIGQDEPDGTVKTDMGRLNAIRFAPAPGPDITPLVSSTPLTPSIPIRKGEATVIYSQQLNDLQRNDQFAVNATLTNNISHLPYNVRIKSRMVVAPDPTATAPGKDVKQMTDPKGEIAEGNGFNCTQRAPDCVTGKVGVMTMRKDAKNDAGDPIPLYANVTLDAARPGAAARPSDVLPISLGGGLAVTLYPAELKG